MEFEAIAVVIITLWNSTKILFFSLPIAPPIHAFFSLPSTTNCLDYDWNKIEWKIFHLNRQLWLNVQRQRWAFCFCFWLFKTQNRNIQRPTTYSALSFMSLTFYTGKKTCFHGKHIAGLQNEKNQYGMLCTLVTSSTYHLHLHFAGFFFTFSLNCSYIVFAPFKMNVFC